MKTLREKAMRPAALKDLFSFDISGKCVDADASIAEAIKKMTEGRHNCLLVKKEGERAIGIISEHDVVSAFAALDNEAKRARVSDHMTIDVVAAQELDTIDEALQMMAAHDVRHLPVVSRDGTVVDFLSIMDLVLKKISLQ
jgi:CBS domain-containing protein